MTRIKGIVVHGKKRGKELGYPTANIQLSNPVPSGIYISQTKIKDIRYLSATFIGNVTSFSEKEIACETHILDFTSDLYDTEIEVELLKKIRENKKFDTIDQLVAQIKRDIDVTRTYFKEHV